jgi:hypothetical protein
MNNYERVIPRLSKILNGKGNIRSREVQRIVTNRPEIVNNFNDQFPNATVCLIDFDWTMGAKSASGLVHWDATSQDSFDAMSIDVFFIDLAMLLNGRISFSSIRRSSLVAVSSDMDLPKFLVSRLYDAGLTFKEAFVCAGSPTLYVYVRSDPLYDVLIPVGPNDVLRWKTTASAAFSYFASVRNIYIVSPLTLESECIVKESEFPFSFKDLINSGIPPNRCGWYLQQLIKLQSLVSLRYLLDRILILDADTVFKSKQLFFSDEYKYGLLTSASELHQPYFSHMARLVPWLSKVRPESGVAHHMPLHRDVVGDLIAEIETYSHGKPWWDAFLAAVDLKNVGAGASEYEIYFNFLFSKNPEKAKVRMLHWNDQYDPSRKHLRYEDCLDFFSDHWHLQSTR